MQAHHLWVASPLRWVDDPTVSFIRLLSTDFDGTLAGGAWGEICAPTLAHELPAVVDGGSLWVVNTGRPLESALDGLESLHLGVSPDYILASERHIFQPDGKGGWIDYGDWNQICTEHHDLLFLEGGGFFFQIEKLAERTTGVRVLHNAEGVPEGLVADTEETLNEVTLDILDLPGRPKNFNFQRSNIYLRFCHQNYNKGNSLAELNRLLDMPVESILAIGDHQNDLSMLYGDVAAMVACPSNAHPLVKESVMNAGGHVSELEAGEGTAEAIHLYRTGKKKPRVLPSMHPVPPSVRLNE